MDSFMRPKKTHVTESLIKESLLRQLSYSVKEVQLQYSQTSKAFKTNEACNSLLVVLEAIFLHGLKRGILHTALKTVGGMDETKPQPSFWGMVASYTHKDTLSTIKKLSQINTDVGRCRVWLRVALNQTELTSYFVAMEKERRPVNSSYNKYAFLRDRETCDTACKLLEGIVSMQFEIPINANILNTWNTEPLVLSGIWSPPLKIPICTATDVAEGIELDNEDEDTCSIKTSSSVTTLTTILALDENQALKIILETPLKQLEKEENNIVPSTVAQANDLIPEEDEEEEEDEKKDTSKTENVKMGNSLSNASGWSSGDFESSEPELEVKTEDSKEEDQRKRTETTYSNLLESYGCDAKEEENYKNILQKLSEKPSLEEADDCDDMEIVPKGNDQFEDLLFNIVREKGLKAQNYTCYSCRLCIGLDFDEARFCHFTGFYYCNMCHMNETSVIPSRLIFNWDHKKYPVCNAANSYLSDIFNGFLVDIKQVNPKLYGAVSDVQKLRTVRFQLNLLRAYLHTCREPVIMELKKRIWPRDYLYEHIHTYSLSDMCKIPGGTLATELNAIISFARDHVLSCWLCSQKGFICEICRNPKVIYPFDCGTTYRCGKCYSVYHESCLASSKNCPKCKRLKKRTSLTDNDSE